MNSSATGPENVEPGFASQVNKELDSKFGGGSGGQPASTAGFGEPGYVPFRTLFLKSSLTTFAGTSAASTRNTSVAQRELSPTAVIRRAFLSCQDTLLRRLTFSAGLEDRVSPRWEESTFLTPLRLRLMVGLGSAREGFRGRCFFVAWSPRAESRIAFVAFLARRGGERKGLDSKGWGNLALRRGE